MANASKLPLATCTGRITIIKDGKDGIGIKNADVVFAIGSNNVNPPADGDNWKTTFAELSLTVDGYVWTCTKITKTDDSVEYSGKYCLGACSDFASIIELYALGDSNTNPPADDAGWKQAYTPVKGKWLWTRNELHFQNSSEVVLTTPVCIGYFANDGTNGTSFKFKGVAYGHFDKASSSTGFNLNECFLLDKDDVSEPNIPSPCVGIYSRFGGVVKLSTDKADVGDAYRIGTSLWVNNGEEWVNAGDIQGPAGDSGKDAIWAVLSPERIIFESDEKGIVKDELRYIVITVFLGSTIITQSCNISFLDASESNFNKSKATVVRTNSSTNILVQSTGIASKKINDDLTITNPYSFLRVKISYEDYVLTFDIGIVVDTSVQDGYFHTSLKGLDAKYSKISSSYDSLSATVTTQDSQIKANYEGIQLQTERIDETNATVNGINTTVQTWQQAGVVTRVDYAGLFAQYAENNKLVARAEIAAFITKDEAGKMISVAKINADQVNIDANHTLAITGNYMTIDATNFKLTKDGTVTCREGSFVNVMMSGFSYRSKVTVNDDNYSDFFGTKFEMEGFRMDGFNIAKAGSWVEFNIGTNPTSGFPSVSLPAIDPTAGYTQSDLDNARALVGSKVIFYNKGRVSISFNGYYRPDESMTIGVSFAIKQGEFAILECKLGLTSAGKEEIYWLYKKGTFAIANS